MDSLTGKVAVVAITGALAAAGASLSAYFSRNAVERKSDDASSKKVVRALVLFFNDQSSFCYADPDHNIDDCPRASQCPQRHIRYV